MGSGTKPHANPNINLHLN